MRDIKLERRRAPVFSRTLEQALRASDEILELLPVATCICDREGRIVQYNQRAVEIWGRKPQPGETHETFSAKTTFYNASGQRLPHSKVTEVLRTGKSARNHEVEVEQPGARLTVLVNVDPLFDSEGKIVGVINCFQDITERKRMEQAIGASQQELRQQEERWNATYEHAAIGIVEVDADGLFLRVNEAICTMTGYSRDELLGRRLFIRTHPEDQDEDARLYRRQVSGEISFYSIQRRFIRKDGVVLWCSVRSSTVRDAAGKFLYSVRVVQDITEPKEAEERQKRLIDELNHRVKNTLATVQSLAAQTAHGTDSPDEFRHAFEGRLIALSHAHDQLTRRHWRSADLRDVISEAVAPHREQSPDRIAIEGEDLTVSPRTALTLSLAFHELATNAGKYGALSVPEGRIEVQWRVIRGQSHEPLLFIEWREHDGPAVVAPARIGFGSRFIEGSVAVELQGTARLQFEAGGLRCSMEIPLRAALPPVDGEA